MQKFSLNIDDRQFFLSTVLARPGEKASLEEPRKDSHRKIAHAAKLSARYIKDILKPHKDEHKTDAILKWIKFVQERAQVILLSVPDDLDAYVMFETLNDRGLRTSQADLLKNYLFKRAGNTRLIEAQRAAFAQISFSDFCKRNNKSVRLFNL